MLHGGSGIGAGRRRGAAGVTFSRARDVATMVAYVWGEDGDPATADADARDHEGRDGTLTIPAGATGNTITIAVRDDADIEPPRETFVVTLLDPDTTEFGVGASTARATINEGVCDRTRELRNALRRSLPCASVSDIDLAERRTLDVSGTGARRRQKSLVGRDRSGVAQVAHAHGRASPRGVSLDHHRPHRSPVRMGLLAASQPKASAGE